VIARTDEAAEPCLGRPFTFDAGVWLGHPKYNFSWEAIMIHLRIAAIAALIASIVGPAYALDWEIERNFRYFEYPSDVALHRVARDIYATKHHRSVPTPAELEGFINDQDFWSRPLVDAGDSRKEWPLSWPRDDTTTTLQLISTLRSEEGNWSGIPRRAPPKNFEEMRRLGWASLLAPGPDRKQYAGATDTCWDPLKHIHSNCSLWGDYVRPSGWVVRVFDPAAPDDELPMAGIGSPLCGRPDAVAIRRKNPRSAGTDKSCTGNSRLS
jgi:hypothetical protein